MTTWKKYAEKKKNMHCHIASFCLHQGPVVFLGTFRGNETSTEFSMENWPNLAKWSMQIALDYHSEVGNDMNSTWFHDWLHLIPFLAQLPFSCRPLVLTLGWKSRCPHLNSFKYKYLKNDDHKPSSWHFISWSYRSASQNLHLQCCNRIPFRWPHGLMPTSRVQLPSKTGHGKLPADFIRSSCASANSNHPIPDDQSTRFAKSLKHFKPNGFRLSPNASKWNWGSLAHVLFFIQNCAWIKWSLPAAS